MAIVQPTGRAQIITPLNNGDIFILGNTNDEADVGGWKIWLMPDMGITFTGAIYILRRPTPITDPNVGFSQSPYRRIVINNLAADCQFDNAALTTVSEVQVEANGSSIAFMVSCSAGSAVVYSRPLNGSVAF